MERELRDNLFGEPAWRGLEATARRFIATGEKLFREHRGDPAFDFAPVIGSFAKALEVQCRAVLRRALAKAPSEARMANLNGETIDLLQHRTLTLGQVAHALTTEQRLASALTTARSDRGWFAGQLPPVLAAFTAVRNTGVHEARVDRATATEWRNRLLGVGSEGIFVRLPNSVKARGRTRPGRSWFHLPACLIRHSIAHRMRHRRTRYRGGSAASHRCIPPVARGALA